MEPVRDWWDRQEFYEDDEFVSVEKVEDAYFIKTSPYPFRPDRGIYRSDRSKGRPGEPKEAGNRDAARKDREDRTATKIDHLAKFTYFLNLDSRADLMSYRMSRKDKKHSETYCERMKRKQKDLETSVTTITTMSHRRKSTDDAKVTGAKIEPAEEQTKRRISRFTATKDSVLLRKIREKSRRKKRLAPKPSSKKRNSGAFGAENSSEETKTKGESKEPPSKMNPRSDKNSQGERQSTIEREQTSSRQDHFFNNYVHEVKSASGDRENKRAGFKGIFPKTYRAADKNEEDKIVRERISKFNQRTDEKLEKRRESSEHVKLTQAKKDNPKMMNPGKFSSASSREAIVFASLDDIRSGDNDVRSFVPEKVKSFESFWTNVRDEAKEARLEDARPYSSEYVGAVKQKFALPTESVEEESRIGLRTKTSSTDPKREQRSFKSLSSGHCNDPPFSPREFGSLAPNVSFLHTYRKTRSFT